MRRILLPVALLLVALVAGIWLGGHADRLPTPVRNALVQQDTATVAEGLGVLDRRYYREVPSKQTQEAALKAAVKSLDDQYSQYLTPEDLVKFNEVTEARFVGIGVEVHKVKQGLEIARVYEDSPAEKAGLKAGDIITGAGGKPLAGLTTAKGSALIRGPEGSVVKLQYDRDGKTTEVTAKRASVNVPLVDSHYDAKAKVGVVRLAQFSEGAADQVQAGIKAMQKKGATSIVLDMRGNPGGLVSEAQKLSSLFLDGGTIVTTRGRSVKTRTLKAGDDPAFPKLPLTVLVDENSASAAEIVTGALQDRKRAEVLGTRTYGKGVFQEIIPLGSGGAMDITVGQYFTPNGRNLGGSGVTKGQDVSRGKGIAPDAKAVDNPNTPQVDEAEQAAIAAAKQ